MGIMNSARGFPVNMNFIPPPGVTPMDASAFMTPQEKYLMSKQSQGAVPATAAPAAGGVPSEGGGAAPAQRGGDSANIQSIMGSLGQGQQGGMMASIMRMLPMIMGG